MGVRKRNPRWGWIWTGALVLGGGGGFATWKQQNDRKQAAELPKGVQTGRVLVGSIDEKITATGTVAAQVGAKVNVGSQISGNIRSLPFDVGASVGAGQVVAELDAPDQVAQVEQQQQSVRVAQASLDQAQSRLRQAELSAALSEEQTRAQIEQADFAARGAEARLKGSEATAKLQPTQTATEVARAEAQLSTTQSEERQVQQTVRLQMLQAQTAIDQARAELDNLTALRRRHEALLARGYISAQEVDDTRSRHRQAAARLRNAQANLDIVREKTSADLQTARNRVTQAEAALEVAQAGELQNTAREADRTTAAEAVRQAQATLRLQRSNRTQDLLRRRAVEEARAAVLQAKANLRQADAALRFQQAQLDKAVIRSPISGQVVSITTQQGETVAAGFQTQTLMTVVDMNRLEVRAYVDETDIGRAQLGLPAEVRVESYPDRVFQGRVTKIASASTVKDSVITYETTIAISNKEGLLRPDMTADVSLILGRRPDVLLIPSEAVHREMKRTVVYVLHREKQGKERVETRPVQVGVDDGSHTQVIRGLKEREEVVLAGLKRLGVEAGDAQDKERGQ